MSGAMTVSMAVIGLAWVATAVVGVLLPGGRRLEAFLALLAGAGTGVASLAVGAFILQLPAEGSSDALFLVSTLLGALTVTLLLIALWNREARSS